MKPKVPKIREHESFVEALERHLGRLATLHDMCRCWGVDQSIVRPKPLAGEIYDENKNTKSRRTAGRFR